MHTDDTTTSRRAALLARGYTTEIDLLDAYARDEISWRQVEERRRQLHPSHHRMAEGAYTDTCRDCSHPGGAHRDVAYLHDDGVRHHETHCVLCGQVAP